jgi:hypothetical protein
MFSFIISGLLFHGLLLIRYLICVLYLLYVLLLGPSSKTVMLQLHKSNWPDTLMREQMEECISSESLKVTEE